MGFTNYGAASPARDLGRVYSIVNETWSQPGGGADRARLAFWVLARYSPRAFALLGTRLIVRVCEDHPSNHEILRGLGEAIHRAVRAGEI